MSSTEVDQSSRKATGLGAIIVLFGLLCFAGQANELLKQWVIAPGSSAELGIAANCRADELEEENLTRQECELLVNNVQILLASSPNWFRPLQMVVSGLAASSALISLVVGIAFVNGASGLQRLAVPVFTLLLALDALGLIAAANGGPMLRSLYLWPQLLWFFIHLSLLMALWQYLASAADAN